MAKQTIAKKLEANFMDCVSEHNNKWPWRESGKGRVTIDMEHTGFFPMIAQKFFNKPRVSHVQLDKYGSAFWKAVDGEHTVLDVLRIMEEQFPDEKDAMQARVVTFCRTLEINKLIRKK